MSYFWRESKNSSLISLMLSFIRFANLAES